MYFNIDEKLLAFFARAHCFENNQKLCWAFCAELLK